MPYYNESTGKWENYGTNPVKNSYIKLVRNESDLSDAEKEAIATSDMTVALASMYKAMPSFNHVIEKKENT